MGLSPSAVTMWPKATMKAAAVPTVRSVRRSRREMARGASVRGCSSGRARGRAGHHGRVLFRSANALGRPRRPVFEALRRHTDRLHPGKRRRAQPFGPTPVVVDGRRRSFPYTGNLYHVAHGDHTLVFACGRTHRSLPFGSIAMHPLSELPRTHRVPSKKIGRAHV